MLAPRSANLTVTFPSSPAGRLARQLTASNVAAAIPLRGRGEPPFAAGLKPFNPVIDTPVECPAGRRGQCLLIDGANWQKAATLDQGLSKDAYQTREPSGLPLARASDRLSPRFSKAPAPPPGCPQTDTVSQCSDLHANWQKGSLFGQGLSKDAFQTPRTYRLAVGVRF